MAIEYNGKSPNKAWYFWQNTKAYFKSFGDYTTKKESLGSVKNLGIGLGALAVGYYVVVPLVAAIPLAPIVASIAACWTGCHFAIKAYQDFRGVKNSSFAYNYVREQEYKWLNKKAEGSVFKRALDSVKKLFTSKKKSPVEGKKPQRTLNGAPISQGVVFEVPTKAPDFNDGAAPPKAGAPANDAREPKAYTPAPRFKSFAP